MFSNNPEEIKAMLEVGFEYICQKNGRVLQEAEIK